MGEELSLSGPRCLYHLCHSHAKPGRCFHPGKAYGWGGSSCGWRGSRTDTISCSGNENDIIPPPGFCTQEPISSPSHSLPSVWQTGQPSFSSYPRRRKRGFSTQVRSWTFTHGWEQRAKEQYWCAAFSLSTVPACFRTDSSLDSHRAHTCPRDVPSPCHIRTSLYNTSPDWHGAAIGPGMET